MYEKIIILNNIERKMGEFLEKIIFGYRNRIIFGNLN